MSENVTTIASEPTTATDTSTVATSEPTAEEKAAQAAQDAQNDAALAAFVAMADAVVEQCDSATGTVADALKDQVRIAYRALTGGIKWRNQAKAHMQDSMKAALDPANVNIPHAVAWNEVQNYVLEPAPRTPAARESVDPTVAYAEHVQTYRLALALVEADVPDNVSADWEDRIPTTDTLAVAQEYARWLNADEDSRGNEPEVSPAVKNAVKMATKKAPKRAGRPAGRPRGGKSRDVAAHIREVFEGLESGEFLTISQIAKTKTSVYGEDETSTGAVTNRLFPPTGAESPLVDVLEPVTSPVRGARKL